MPQNQKVILRFINGKMLKGYVQDVKISDEYLYIMDESDQQHKVRLKELKAIFFVKKFEGERSRPERKHPSGPTATKRIVVKFKDGESIMGSMEGGSAWEKGSAASRTEKAFTIIPDDDSNNTKIMVVSTAVKDVDDIGS